MRGQLFALVGLVFVGFAVLVSMTLAVIDRVQVGGPIYESIRADQLVRQTLGLLRSDLSEIRALTTTAWYTTDPEELARLRQEADQLTRTTDATLSELSATAHKGALGTALLSAKATWTEFRAAHRAIFDWRSTRADSPPASLRRMQELRLERFTDQIDSALHALILQSQDLEEQAKVIVQRRVRAVLLASLLLGGIVVTVTLVIARSITRPLGRLTGACATLAAGDLATLVEVQGGRELAQVAAAFNGMAREVRTALERSQAAESQLRQIYDSTSDGILLLGGDARLLAANRRAGEFLRFDPRDVVGRTLGELLSEHGVTAEHFHRPQGKRPAQGSAEVEWRGDLALPALGGMLHWVARPAMDPMRDQAAVTLTLHDVTVERQAEQLRSDFVSFATHQLRTPLSGVKWLLELAVQNPALPADARSYVEDARTAAGRLIGMVTDLLDISRLEGGRIKVSPVPVSIADVTRGVVADLRPLAEKKTLRLSAGGLDSVPAVLADAQLLRQVVLNRVSNAIKYTPDGGEIAVRIVEDGAQVRWEIHDTGIGVPAEDQARLFEKFHRADNAAILDSEGTGLGLYLVRLVVERLGGRVRCDSVEGRGSTFSFTLPLARSRPWESPLSASSSSKTTGS